MIGALNGPAIGAGLYLALADAIGAARDLFVSSRGRLPPVRDTRDR